MKSPPVASNEEERLAVLRRYQILDTDPEKGFDDLTYLASFICQAPISLVSLIDKERQWFKSRRGIDASEISREISFCAHAMLQPQMMIVEDTFKDDRFSDNPFVTQEPHVRFYAGAPLYTADGFALGTICVIDRVPRTLSEFQHQALEALSRQAGSLIEQRRNLIELSEALGTIKLLSGLLPICASCKKIRDEQGQWEVLEGYIQQHSEAKFSHGMCPDCMNRLYPGYKKK